MASTDDNHVIIRPYCKSDSDAVLNHLQNYFRLDSPLISSLDFSKDEIEPFFLQHLDDVEKAELSYVACDLDIEEKNESIIGCALVSIEDHEDPSWKGHQQIPLTNDKIKALISFVDSMYKQPLLEFSTARILKIDILSVAPAYQGRGLSRKMVELCLQDSVVRKSCDVALSLATSYKSQELLVKEKFITLICRYFEEYNKQLCTGSPQFLMKDPRNISARVLAKVLT